MFLRKIGVICGATLVSLSVSQTAIAAGICEVSGNDCFDVKIEAIYQANNGNIFFITDGQEENLACDFSSGWVEVVPLGTAPNTEEKTLSILLSAHMAQTTVNVRMNNNSDPCEMKYIVSTAGL